MSNPWRSGKDFFEGVLYNAMFGFCNFFWHVADKLDDFAAAIEVDEAVLETVPRKFAEKKRKKMPSKKILDAGSVTDREITGDHINVHHILTGFDEDSLQSATKRIAEACAFILGNAETNVEKYIARQLAKMLSKGVVLVTDADLVLDKKIAGCFYTKEGIPYIGLDIANTLRTDDAGLIQTLAHESYHAWRHFSSPTEYSIIDEKRAWNTGLQFSNRYRNRYGIPVEREEEYTEGELLIHADYLEKANVNIRYGPGENIIETIGYGIANFIGNAADALEGVTEKIIDKTFQV